VTSGPIDPTASDGDRFAAAKAVADAVVYEGYVLYPYRASARKNQMRWQFGVLVPPESSALDPSERSTMRTELIVDPGAAPTLSVRVRCLQVQRRSVEVFGDVDSLDEPLIPWDEAVEQIVEIPAQDLLPLVTASRVEQFRFSSAEEPEIVHSPNREAVARLVRRRESVDGRVVVKATPVAGSGSGPEGDGGSEGLLRLTVTVENLTVWPGATTSPARDKVLRHSLVAVHTMLAVDDGRFVSLLDPPESAREAVAGCVNEGTFPVLISPDDDVVLSSPITLYDHPAVAPESPGDLYDSTEIDEILALRILTLTDDEKAEARATDPRAAAIVDRVDDMTPELWEQLHGTVRPVGPTVLPVQALADIPWWDPGTGTGSTSAGSSPNDPAAATGSTGATGFTGSAGFSGSIPTYRTPGDGRLPVQAIADVPWWDPGVDSSVDPTTDSIRIGEVDVSRGSRVRLRPSRRADAQDLFLVGQEATVAAVFHDVDGGEHVAVTLDGDPGADLYRESGRFLYFHPDEVEPLDDQGGPPKTTRRVLVAGIGNIFLGDDGFGVEVANRLAGRTLPEGVRAADYGIRGIHLAYELLEGYDALILLDAMPLGEPAGTLAVVEPEQVAPPTGEDGMPVMDAHTMHPGVVLGMLEMLDAHVERIVIIGCQPLSFDGMGLSAPVAEAVDLAVDLLEEVLTDVCETAVSEART